MKRKLFIASMFYLAGASGVLSENVASTRLPTAQFPEPKTAKTDMEAIGYKQYYLNRYNGLHNYTYNRRGFTLSGPGIQTSSVSLEAARGAYAETDVDGRPFWFDGPGIVELDQLVETLLNNKKFSDLDRLIFDWTNRTKKNADGRSTLRRFQYAVTNRLLRSKNWDKGAELIAEWKAVDPKSVGAALYEAEYWHAYARSARGSGWASSVSEEAWDLFTERAKKAEKALLDSKPYASGNPLWGMTYLEISTGLRWSLEEQAKLFAELVAQHPDFTPYYFWMSEQLTPYWGGDWDMFDAFAREVANSRNVADGAGMYARLYWNTASMRPTLVDLFRDTRADWQLMKKGFEALQKAYPHSAHNANAFARFACAAGDGATYEKVREQIGASIISDDWPSNLQPDVCQERFRRKGT